MTTRQDTSLRCPCGTGPYTTVHTYTTRPDGEVGFRFSSGPYLRDLRRCQTCGHVLSVHDMDDGGLYEGAYVDATYGQDGIRTAFDRINALPAAASDNIARVARVIEYAASHRGLKASRGSAPTLLDVGSGLCVFAYRMREAGWDCTALDPDPRAARHAREVAGVRSVCGDFRDATGLGRYDAVSFNKVLEHIEEPIATLAAARELLTPGGFVYVEVPDGEMAFRDGPGREEFFIEHHHVFSAASLCLLAARAGFAVHVLERLREPSSKYTLRAFAIVGGEE